MTRRTALRPKWLRQATFAALVGLTAGAVQPGPAQAESYELTLCAASVGGTWSLIGAGIDAAMKASYPGSVVTIQTSAGGIANAASLQSSSCDMAIMHSPEIGLALSGKEPFREPMDNIRMLASIENWSPMHFMVSKALADKYGLKTTADIAKGKVPIRIVLQRPGNIAYAVARDILIESGATLEDIKSWGGTILHGASSEQADLVRDRRADGGANVLFPGSAQVLDLAQGVPITLLSVPDDVRARIAEQWNVPEFTIEASTYDFIDEDVKTVTLGGQLVTLNSLPDETVRAVLTAIVDHADLIAGVHPSMRRLNAANFSASGHPYHDAATEFYRERGMLPAN